MFLQPRKEIVVNPAQFSSMAIMAASVMLHQFKSILVNFAHLSASAMTGMSVMYRQLSKLIVVKLSKFSAMAMTISFVT
jgi:hypothetical protein